MRPKTDKWLIPNQIAKTAAATMRSKSVEVDKNLEDHPQTHPVPALSLKSTQPNTHPLQVYLYLMLWVFIF